MVLEGLLRVKEAERTPFIVFLLGFLYASVAVFLSLWIFRSEASLILVFLIVFASLPLVNSVLRYETFRDVKAKDDVYLSGGHWRALRVFMYLFFGSVLALAFWFVLLPSAVVSDLFASQLATIQVINAPSATGSVTAWNFLSVIVVNNLKVLLFCLLFSFFFGAGAIFILTWNASVISAAIGTFFRSGAARYAEYVGLFKVGGYLHIFSLGLLRYMVHGVFEILAYFIAGLAGGLISVAMLHREFEGGQFRKVMRDAVDLLILSVLVVIIAGFVEVFVTPLLFA